MLKIHRLFLYVALEDLMINIRLNSLRLLKIRKDHSNNEDLTKHLKKNIPGSNFLSKKIKFTYKQIYK